MKCNPDKPLGSLLSLHCEQICLPNFKPHFEKRCTTGTIFIYAASQITENKVTCWYMFRHMKFELPPEANNTWIPIKADV